jgi:hypothetical protein
MEGDAHGFGNGPGIRDGRVGIAGIKPHNGTAAVKTSVFHQICGYRRVYAAAHCDQCFHSITSRICAKFTTNPGEKQSLCAGNTYLFFFVILQICMKVWEIQ